MADVWDTLAGIKGAVLLCLDFVLGLQGRMVVVAAGL